MTSTRYSRVELARNWDPAKHPRGPLGRFARVSGTQSRALPPADQLRTREEVEQALDIVRSRAIESGSWRPGEVVPSEFHPYMKRMNEIALAEIEAPPADTGFSRSEDADWAEEWGIGYPSTTEQEEARMAYMTDSSINQYLRGDQSLADEPADPMGARFAGRDQTVVEAVNELDSMMKPTDRRLGLYRGMDPRLADGLRAGDMVTDSAFMSTSVDRESAEIYGRVVEIDAPAGTPAGVGYVDHEEIILGRGTTLEILEASSTRIRARVIRRSE